MSLKGLPVCLSVCMPICSFARLRAYQYICLFIRLSNCCVHLPVHLSVRLVVCPHACDSLSVRMFVRLPIYLYAWPSVRPPARLSVRLPVCLSACPSVRPPARLSGRLPVCFCKQIFNLDPIIVVC